MTFDNSAVVWRVRLITPLSFGEYHGAEIIKKIDSKNDERRTSDDDRRYGGSETVLRGCLVRIVSPFIRVSDPADCALMS